METQAESTAPAVAPEVDSEVATATGEGSAPSGTEAAASGDDTSNWTEKAQKRYDELTRERYEAAARADRAEYRLQEAERRLAEREAAKAETVAPSDDYPTLESVGFVEEDHKAAVAAWVKRQTGEVVKSTLAQEREAAQRAQTQREWEKRQGDFIKAKPDYAQKVGGLPPSLMTDSLAQEIKASDMGPEVAYYLAENMDKLAAIAQLPPSAQAREIGRIEARLEAAKAAPPPVSKAPAPVARIETAASSASVAPDDPESDNKWSSADEWAKARNKQELKRRG